MTSIRGDQTLALLREGYPFIQARCEKLGSDVFDTRLMLRTTTCLTGRDAAELFYDESRMSRDGAMPGRVLKTLIGKGGVQTLDGDTHKARKAMMLSLVTGDGLEDLCGRAASEWRRARERWPRGEPIVLLAEARTVLCRAVCAWAGLRVDDAESGRRARELDALIRGPGAVAAGYLRGRTARLGLESWLAEKIEAAREEDVSDARDALHTIARYRDPEGTLLEPRVAAVELLNFLRPTVALSVYISFAGHALHSYPDARPRSGDPAEYERFAHEVRRFYPFFPFAAAVTSHSFEWRNHRFPSGRRVLLDLYGTCRDRRLWDAPDSFRPERFASTQIDPYALIPQGGGDHHRHHRCAGEWLSVRIIADAARFLLEEVDYRVPDQDLSIDLARIPTEPATGFVIVVE